MKVFILTTKHSAMLETFKTLSLLIDRIKQINIDCYDGGSFSTYGVSFDFETGEDLSHMYFVDSAILTKRVGGVAVYDTYLIHAIDLNTGNKTTLI